MPWVRMDDTYPEHLKVDGLSDVAFRLDVSAWCWSSRNLTDGRLPKGWAQRLVPKFRAAAVDELLSEGRWHPATHECSRCPQGDPGGYVVHDFLAFNPSADKVRADREAERVKKANQRAKGGSRAKKGTDGKFVSPRDSQGDAPVGVPRYPSRPEGSRDGECLNPGDPAPAAAVVAPEVNVAMARSLKASLKGEVIQLKRSEAS